MDKPTVLRISRIVNEAKDLKTFVFRHKLNAKPGQFIMLWLPGVDEKPFSVSYQDDERFAVTVFKIGSFTEKLFELRPGDKAGIRGPYGNPFTLRGQTAALVGGGCGAAPLGFLADELRKRRVKLYYIIGAKTKECLLFETRMKYAGVKTYFATDDGSKGHHGYTTDVLKKLLKKKKIDMVYTCGPEIMMKIVAEICEKADVPCEISMERHMKCGFGICGQCCIDHSGERVCKEGPVFSGEKIKKIFEFGKYKREASGKKVEF
jgi:dihydroorotate dehydrogenase electron transfer subunit